MPPRVRTRFALNRLPTDLVRQFQRGAQKGLRKSIVKRIESGSSPVRGEGKFKKYSKSYKETIRGKKTFRTIGGKVVPMNMQDTQVTRHGKKVRPVNMKLTGKMLKSLTVRKIKKGISIIFTDPKAIFHDQLGAGKSKTIRRLLPTRKGESFYRPIQKEIERAMGRALKRALRRQNRR